MYVSTAGAAERLGTGTGRVRELIADGLLPAERIGGRWLVPEEAVEERRRAARAPVRPMAPRVAWAAAALVAGQEAGWLSESERSRLRRRLRTRGGDVALWRAWLLRRAVAAERLRVAEPGIADLVRDTRVVVSGADAAARLGSDLTAIAQAEVYVESARDLAALRRTYGLVASAAPNVVLRVAGGPWAGSTATVRRGLRVVPAPVVAVDLLDADDSRSRRAGSALLARTLGTYDG